MTQRLSIDQSDMFSLILKKPSDGIGQAPSAEGSFQTALTVDYPPSGLASPMNKRVGSLTALLGSAHEAQRWLSLRLASFKHLCQVGRARGQGRFSDSACLTLVRLRVSFSLFPSSVPQAHSTNSGNLRPNPT